MARHGTCRGYALDLAGGERGAHARVQPGGRDIIPLKDVADIVALVVEHGADIERAERFVQDLKAVVRPDENVLLLCRSGVRSHHAARVAYDAGYDSVFNVLEGFEGQRNHAQQRGFVDGWRSHGLPWIQD